MEKKLKNLFFLPGKEIAVVHFPGTKKKKQTFFYGRKNFFRWK